MYFFFFFVCKYYEDKIFRSILMVSHRVLPSFSTIKNCHNCHFLSVDFPYISSNSFCNFMISSRYCAASKNSNFLAASFIFFFIFSMTASRSAFVWYC